MSGETILVVDDSATIRKIIDRELREAGYEVLTATNGIEALSMLAWMERKPDLITLDIDMPRMNGFEVCRRLREDHDKEVRSGRAVDPIPVIFVSANDSLEDRRRGFQLEVLDFITKPFPRGRVARVVKDILAPDRRFEGLRALVVDDSSSIRRIIGRLLQRLGVQVSEAANGLEGLRIIEKGKLSFDMVVTDYHMPEMRGDEFCRLLRQHREMRRIPVIIVSAFDEPDLILAFFQAGATDYLSKPFIEEELLARLQSHLQSRAYSRRLEELNRQLTHLAERDGLTELYNRRYFQDNLHARFAEMRQTGRELSCILLDLDFFKKINDECGHGFGDLVLKEFADLLHTQAGPGDIVARYGGEEFILLLPGKPLAQALALGEAIRTATEKHLFSDGSLERRVTCSVGVSSLHTHKPDTPDRLVTLADEALYRAKAEGRNRVESA